MHGRRAKEKVAQDQAVIPPLAFVALLGANIALAFGPWFVRMADVGPVAAGFWRIALAVPLLGALAVAGGARPVKLGRGMVIALAISGVAFAVDLGAWHLGILHTTLANATLFGNCAVLIFPIYGFIVARAWPTRAQSLALALAALGGGLLLGRSYQLDPRHLVGDLLCLTAGVFYAGYFIVMTRVRAVMAPLPALTLSSAASLAPLLVFAALLGERIWPANWGPLIALAVLSQTLGQGLMTFALGRLSPLVVGVALLTQPIVAATIGWFVYGERLGALDLVGAALVAAALVLVRRGEMKAAPAANPVPEEAR